MSAFPTGARKIRPSRWWHLVAIGMVAIGLFSAYRAIKKAIHSFDGITQAIFPGSVVVPFSAPGESYIYYESQSEFGGRVFDTGTDVPGLKFTVTNADTNETIPLQRPGMSQTYSINGRQGRAVLQFRIVKPGRYKITGSYDDDERHDDAIFAVGDVRIGEFILLIFTAIFSLLIVGGAGLVLIVLIEVWRQSSNRKLAGGQVVGGGDALASGGL